MNHFFLIWRKGDIHQNIETYDNYENIDGFDFFYIRYIYILCNMYIRIIEASTWKAIPVCHSTQMYR